MCVVAIHWLDDNGDGNDGGDGDGGDDDGGRDDVGMVEEAVTMIKRRKEELTHIECS